LAALKRTPCVGICSTTYGDLVCRGCKRFAHEIVAWNGYDESQRGLVWHRLFDLLDGVVAERLRIVDLERLEALAVELRILERAALSDNVLAFEVLRRCARRDISLAELGLAGEVDLSVQEALDAIEREYYERSLARYERDFRTLAK